MTGLSAAKIWVLTDGKAGHTNQCLGLAAALGIHPDIKRVAPGFPWSRLPPQLWLNPLRAADPDGDQLVPPWPDMVIAAGRRTVAPALAIKSASGGRAFLVQVQDPAGRRARFDLIAAPRHDGLTGDNVIQTAGALTGITEAALTRAAGRFADTLATLPRPLVAVLIGGSNGKYRMTERTTADLAAGLKRLSDAHGAGLAITASRRTGEENEARLRAGLAGTAWWFWDGRGDNPYLGLLALADAIVVTADSVSMVSEACSTGKPVYVAGLEGGSDKFDRFHAHLRDRGMTRPFDGTLESWTYEALRDTEIVAAEVARRYAAFASAPAAS
ncbi:MAG: mitochondrial fission ELM1 family protein [Alphaproteobacteria bacterium]